MGIRNDLFKRGLAVAQAVSETKFGLSSGGKAAYREVKNVRKVAREVSGYPMHGGGARTTKELFAGMSSGARARVASDAARGTVHIPRPAARDALYGTRMGLPPSPVRRAARMGFGAEAGLKTPLLTSRGPTKASKRRLVKYGMAAGGVGLGAAVMHGNNSRSAKRAGTPMSGGGMYGTTSTNPMTPRGF